MNNGENHEAVWGRAIASLSIASVLMLLGACGDGGTDVEIPEGQRYLEEAFEVTVENDVQYGSATNEDGQEETLLLDVYVPMNDGGEVRPAIVWLHGGSFQFGAKGDMAEFAERFARRGYVSVAANYRLRENDVFDYTDPDDPLAEPVKADAQHDAQAAVRWLRANADGYRVDADRIFVVGYSAGATTALRVAAHSDDPGTSGNPEFPSDVSGAIGVAASLDPGVLEDASGPTLLIHGEADRKITFADIEAACSAVETCELVPIPGVEHDLVDVVPEEIVSEASRFLKEQVTG